MTVVLRARSEELTPQDLQDVAWSLAQFAVIACTTKVSAPSDNVSVHWGHAVMMWLAPRAVIHARPILREVRYAARGHAASSLEG
eukprot:2485739-Amphidinium_carterae.1